MQAPAEDTNDATGGTTESGISGNKGLVFTGTPKKAGFDKLVSVTVDLSITGPDQTTLVFTPTGIATGPNTADQAVPDDKRDAVLSAFSAAMPGQQLPFGLRPTTEGARGSDLIIEGIAEDVTVRLDGFPGMSALLTAGAAIAAAMGIAGIVGVLHNRRAGVLRHTEHPEGLADTADLGLSNTSPTIVHFTAVWCGPCAAVRRVIHQVRADLPQVAHVEIDMDANPAAARKLSVLSLPTTFIFDADRRQRYRSAGVPKAADLKAALEPLLTLAR